MKILLAILMLMPVSALLADNGGFLFVTFKGEQTPMSEQIYFGLSKDGLDWEQLNGGEPVLVSDIGEKGARDPFLLRSHDGGKYYLIATDLSINRNRDWGRAVQKGSRSLLIWESEDLLKWSKPRLVKVAADEAGCTWAPEAFYDEEAGDYLVFWASTTKSDNFGKQRIWAARTKDFRTFGDPFIYIETPAQVIDTTMVRENGNYYRFSKDEKFKAITMEVSGHLMGPWRDVTNFSLAKLVGYEGPECFPLGGGKWCLLLDYYSKGQGYQPFVTDDLANGQFRPMEGFHTPFRFRHGFPFALTTEEYERVKAAWTRPVP